MFNQASLNSCSSISQYQLLLNTWSIFFQSNVNFHSIAQFFLNNISIYQRPPTLYYKIVLLRHWWNLERIMMQFKPAGVLIYYWSYIDIDHKLRGCWCTPWSNSTPTAYWEDIDQILVLINNWENIDIDQKLRKHW